MDVKKNKTNLSKWCDINHLPEHSLLHSNTIHTNVLLMRNYWEKTHKGKKRVTSRREVMKWEVTLESLMTDLEPAHTCYSAPRMKVQVVLLFVFVFLCSYIRHVFSPSLSLFTSFCIMKKGCFLDEWCVSCFCAHICPINTLLVHTQTHYVTWNHWCVYEWENSPVLTC